MTHSRTDTSGRSSDLRTSIDRAVRRARSGRLLGAGGCWLATAAATLATLAAVDAISGGRLAIASLPVAAKLPLVLAIASVPAAALCRLRLIHTGWPSRLTIALATEKRHPRLGETLSRAIEFLNDEPPAAARLQPLTMDAFRRLAIDQAAASARDAGGFALPGIAADVGWAVTGVAAALAVWGSMLLLPGGWADAVRRQVIATPVETVVGTEPAPDGQAIDAVDEPLPPEVQAAATRLAGAAAVERRLAEVLTTIFAQAPGIAAAQLSPAGRRRLEDLAAIQAGCLRAIDTSRRLLQAAAASPGASVAPSAARHRDQLRRALEQLDRLDRAAAVTVDISANRLHRAGDATLDVADILASAVTALGMAADAAPNQGIAMIGHGGPEIGGPLADAASALDRIAAEHGQELSATASTGEPDSRETNAGVAGPNGADGSAVAAGVTSATAAAQTGTDRGPASTRRTAVPTDAPPIERVWDLLIAGERPQAAREAVDLAPSAYRPAIDTYYRLLLQSLSDRPGPPTPPTPPR